jgi:Domain of unknown function (DUF1905)/Bacteriocin-protection, YdeI or OmpD-Associated
MRFTAVVVSAGKTATGIEVPENIVQGLGGSKRPAVTATINGYSYRTSVASMGGRFMMPISAAVRESSGVSAGDEIDVELVLDSQVRVVEVPPDLATALEGGSVRAEFEALSTTNKKRIVLSVQGAKTDETRRRRIARAVAELAEGRS